MKTDQNQTQPNSPVGENPRSSAAKTPGDREEDQYVIDALLKGMQVFFALEGSDFEPANIGRIAKRAGVNRDFCRRALITFKRCHVARQLVDSKESLFVYGPKVETLAKRYGASLLKG